MVASLERQTLPQLATARWTGRAAYLASAHKRKGNIGRNLWSVVS